MSRNSNRHSRRSSKRQLQSRHPGIRRRAQRPGAAFRQRGTVSTGTNEQFTAPEDWHEPTGRSNMKLIVRNPGKGYVHAVTPDDVRERIAELPRKFTQGLEVVQLSGMTRKRALFPFYGMQWGNAVYLYPIEQTFVEVYVRPPRPQQVIEAEMYGGKWVPDGKDWRLEWTADSIRDFYLNNVLIHEIGHIYDDRNTSFEDRERYANWFAIEHGYRASRGRR
jgi:hypothetical protein